MNRVLKSAESLWKAHVLDMSEDASKYAASKVRTQHELACMRRVSDAVEYVVFIDSCGESVAPMPEVSPWE